MDTVKCISEKIIEHIESISGTHGKYFDHDQHIGTINQVALTEQSLTTLQNINVVLERENSFPNSMSCSLASPHCQRVSSFIIEHVVAQFFYHFVYTLKDKRSFMIFINLKPYLPYANCLLPYIGMLLGNVLFSIFGMCHRIFIEF